MVLRPSHALWQATERFKYGAWLLTSTTRHVRMREWRQSAALAQRADGTISSNACTTSRFLLRRYAPALNTYTLWGFATKQDRGKSIIIACLGDMASSQFILLHCGIWITFPAFLLYGSLSNGKENLKVGTILKFDQSVRSEYNLLQIANIEYENLGTMV